MTDTSGARVTSGMRPPSRATVAARPTRRGWDGRGCLALYGSASATCWGASLRPRDVLPTTTSLGSPRSCANATEHTRAIAGVHDDGQTCRQGGSRETPERERDAKRASDDERAVYQGKRQDERDGKAGCDQRLVRRSDTRASALGAKYASRSVRRSRRMISPRPRPYLYIWRAKVPRRARRRWNTRRLGS